MEGNPGESAYLLHLSELLRVRLWRHCRIPMGMQYSAGPKDRQCTIGFGAQTIASGYYVGAVLSFRSG